MKKILSLLLVALMLVGMLPMNAIHAHAAEQSVTLNLSDSSNRTTFSTTQQIWEQNGITVTNNKGSSSSDVADYTPPRFYKSSEVIIFCSLGNITKIELVCSGSSYATALKSSVGNEAVANGSTVTITPTVASDTYTISSLSGGQVRMGNSITVTYATVDSGECAHTNTETIVAVAATCTTAGNTAGVKCADCGAVLEGNETIAALGHTNDEGVVTAPTCTEKGYTLYTCTVCGSTKKDNYVDATGHNYVDGVCSVCSVAMPTGLAGEYYIAAKRSTSNYFYLTNTVNDKSRYVAVDSTLTELPASIESVDATQVFELIFDASAGTYKIKTGDQYLGWTSGNSGTLVDEAAAIAATIEAAESGAYNIHFTSVSTSETVERYLALNSNAANAYFAWYKQGQAEDLYLVPVAGDDEWESEPDTTDPSEPEATDPEPTEAPTSSSATITFDDTTKRTTFTTSQQVWEENGITVTNNKSSSTSNVADYVQPARFYKSSNLIIKYNAKMTKIEVNCNTADYATAFGESISDTNATVTVSDKVVSIVFTEAVESFTIASMSAQVRVDSINVYAEEGAHVHSWGEWTGTEATCTTAGEKTRTCSGCGETETQTSPATGHTYVYADCVLSCSACSVTFEPTPIVNTRTYTEGEVYYFEGVVTYVDSKQAFIQDETAGICVYFDGGAPADIAVGDKIRVWDALTTFNGLIETTYTKTTEYAEVSEGNSVEAQALTIETLKNETTNEYLSELVSLSGVTVSAAAYNSDYGNVTYTLTDADGNTIDIFRVAVASEAECVAVDSVVDVEAIASTFNGTYQLVTTNDKIVVDVCATNGHTEVVDAAVAATCTSAGKTAGKHCSVCNEVLVAQEEVPALGHKYENGVCTVCGESDPDAGPIEDANLKFYQVGLSFAEYIGVQPMMLTSVVKNYDSYYVEAVLTREDGTETIVLEPTLSTSSYNVYDVQMLPRAMTDGVTLTIYAVKDGVTYCSNPVNTSITALAIEKIGTYLAKDDLGACTVLVDMLNYGTEVQKAFDYKTDDVPSNYLGEYAVYGTTGDIAIEGAVSTSGSGIRVYANSLSLGSKVEVQFMFKTSAVEGCELRYTLNGETIAVPASEFDTTVMSGYSVAIFAMKPRNFRDTMTIAVYDATGAVISAVYTASIEDYAAGAITKYPTLVPAMMAYGDAVLARFPG